MRDYVAANEAFDHALELAEIAPVARGHDHHRARGDVAQGRLDGGLQGLGGRLGRGGRGRRLRIRRRFGHGNSRRERLHGRFGSGRLCRLGRLAIRRLGEVGVEGLVGVAGLYPVQGPGQVAAYTTRSDSPRVLVTGNLT